MEIENVSLGFAQGSVAEVVGTALTVNDNLYNNAYFPVPTVSQTELQTARVAVESAQGAMAQGGTATTADRDKLLGVLVTQLRTLAGYVQKESANDLAKLLSSGFKAVSKNHTREVLGVPQLLKLNGGIAGQLKAGSSRPPNTRALEMQVALVAEDGQIGEWRLAGIYTNSRSMIAAGLVPGALHAVRVRGVGGLTGYSGWSNVVISRCP